MIIVLPAVMYIRQISLPRIFTQGVCCWSREFSSTALAGKYATDIHDGGQLRGSSARHL